MRTEIADTFRVLNNTKIKRHSKATVALVSGGIRSHNPSKQVATGTGNLLYKWKNVWEFTHCKQMLIISSHLRT